MKHFSLDKFLQKKEQSTPEWSQRNETIKKAYTAVIERIKEIEDSLNKLSPKELEQLKIKERQIIVKKIAESVGVSRSALRKDRAPELDDFINKENFRLVQVWKNIFDVRYSGRRSTKDELAERIKEKDHEIEALKQSNYKDYFEAAMQSEVLGSQHDLAEKILELKELRRSDQKKIAVLSQRIEGLMRELNSK